jgi:hypothetical protein
MKLLDFPDTVWCNHAANETPGEGPTTSKNHIAAT